MNSAINKKQDEKNQLKEIEKNLRADITTLQKYEKMLQNILYTKERMNMDIRAIEVAQNQLKTKQKEIYRFYGPILLKKNQEEIKKELEEEKEEIDIKQKTIKKQEDAVKKIYADLRGKIIATQKEIRNKISGMQSRN